MNEREIATVLGWSYVPRLERYAVRLGFRGEPAETVWMTWKQLHQLQRVFSSTPRGPSSDRLSVVGVWNERGYYAYARLERQRFQPPIQYRLSDLKEDEGGYNGPEDHCTSDR